MKRAILLLLLAPSLAGATTWTYTFEDASPHHIAQQIRTVSGNGFTLTFGPAWRRAVDSDACTPPNGCVLPTNQGELGPWGDFANEPSGTCAGYTLDSIDDSLTIYITPAILSLSFRYSGTPLFCDENWCYEGIANLPIRVDAFVPGGWYPPVASVEFNEPGDTWATGCSGDPEGVQCMWPTAELYFDQPVGLVRILNSWPGIVPFYVDDLKVGNPDACPHPPCEFERATQDRETPAKRASWGALKAIYR